VRQTHQIRFSPAKYRQKFYNDPQLKGLNIANATIDVRAAAAGWLYKVCRRQ
jgi:hypothetical protein